MKKRFKFPVLKMLRAIGDDIPSIVNSAVDAWNNEQASRPVDRQPFRLWFVMLEALPSLRIVALTVIAAKADGVVDDDEIGEIASAVAIAIVVPLSAELSRAHGAQITADEWEMIAGDAAARLVPKIVAVLKEANA